MSRPTNTPTARRLVRLSDRGLVGAVLALWLLWTSHGDLTRAVPGGQPLALASVTGLVALLALARLALAGTPRRWWRAVRAAPAPLLLALLLLAAVAPRLVGPHATAPRYGDVERQALNEARRMLTTGDYRPHTFARPSALLYLQTAAGGVAFIVGVSSDRWRAVEAVQPADLAPAARLLDLLLALLTIALVYAVGRRDGNRRAGLLAAALLAASPLAWTAARAATEDALVALVGLAAFWAVGVVTREERGRLAPSLLAALSIGFATGVRPSLFLLTVPFLAVLLLRRAVRPKPWGWGLLLAAGLAGYLLAVPYALAALPALLDASAVALREYDLRATPGTLVVLARRLPTALLLLAREDPLLALTGGGGALLAISRLGARHPSQVSRSDGPLLLAFLVPTALLLLSRRQLDARQFLPYAPFLALLGGAFLDAAWTFTQAQWRHSPRHRARRDVPAGR